MPVVLGAASAPPRLGNHELLIELAAGGMATVYVARKLGAAGFERLVVVKRVHPAFAKNREFSDMFRDEARICATIRHPNVVQILDVVETEGELFLVLDYVESLSLRALCAATAAAGEPLAPAVVVRIVADALAGLHAAHEAKDLRGQPLDLIHRDVSPQNIIVGVDGASRLIDFGIAKAASRVSVTSSGVLKGKLSYMSPEQVRRRPLDRRADVFAAGVVLFEALTNRRLFHGEDEGDIVLGILAGDVPPPSSIAPGVPPELDSVVKKALEQERAERYQTAAAFQEDLERALMPAPAREVTRAVETHGKETLERRRAELRASLDGEGGPIGAEASGRMPRAARDGGTEIGVETATERRAPRSGYVWAIAATAVIAAAAAVGAVWMKGSRDAPAAATATDRSAPPAASGAEPTGGANPASDPAGAARDASVATATSTATPPPPPHAPPTPAPTSTSRPVKPTQDIHRRNPYAAP